MVGCTFFSKKDLDSGYYQCLMDPASQKYTAMLRTEGFGNMIRAAVINNSYKESLAKYKQYCNQ
jgi:hypothetical protein